MFKRTEIAVMSISLAVAIAGVVVTLQPNRQPGAAASSTQPASQTKANADHSSSALPGVATTMQPADDAPSDGGSRD